VVSLAAVFTTPPGAATTHATLPVASGAEPLLINDNGGWSWFEDERAVVDLDRCTLLVSSVASASGSGGEERDGNIELVSHDLVSATTMRSTLYLGPSGNDHNSAALYVRRDGRYVAMYSLHDTDTLTRWRVSRRPGDAREWGPERYFDHRARTTYSNIYAVPDDDRLYAFVRAADRDPHFLVSDDDGSSWTAGGRLLTSPGRPYLRYASDGAGRIHLIATDGQPSGNELVTGIYHGVLANGQLLRSDGVLADSDVFDDDAPISNQLTQVFAASDRLRPWPIDVQLDASGNPRTVFSVRVPGASAESDRRFYYYGRFDGSTWHVHRMAYAGSALSVAHRDYTGLAAIDPREPSRVYVSTDVDPGTGVPLISGRDQRRHFEIFAGVTDDGGATWAWSPFTADSTVDNIRPIVPESETGMAVLWLRGTYRDYKRYDLDVVGVLTSRCTRSGS
jgi:BNR repeat-containing family member